MEKEIKIKIPQSYADITLRQYLALQKQLKNYEGEEDAQTAVMVSYLTGLDAQYISGLSMEDYETIAGDLSNFINNTELPFQQRVWIGEKEYGFIPNLADIEYGAYLDITRYDTITIDDNWAKIMDIIYRPITKKIRDTYEIAPYTGDIDENKWLDVSMDVHFGALFFFVNILTDCLNDTLNSLKGEMLPPNIKSVLGKSGEVMQRLLKLQTGI